MVNKNDAEATLKELAKASGITLAGWQLDVGVQVLTGEREELPLIAGGPRSVMQRLVESAQAVEKLEEETDG